MASEELTRDELERLSGALDAVAWTAEPTLRLTSVSANAEDVLGHPRSAWLERDFFASRLHPDEREVTLALCHAVATDGRQRRFLHRFFGPDGRALWVRTVLAAREEQAVITRLVGLTAVVPELVDLRERELEAQRLILDQLPAIVWTTDRELRFTSGSGGGLAAVGLLPDQLVGGTVYEYFRVEVEDAAQPYVAAHLRALAGDNATFDADWIGRSYEIHVEPFRDRDREIVGVIGVAHDVTERHHAEAERDAQRQLLTALIANMVEGVFVSDVEGRFTLVNAAARRMFATVDETVTDSIPEFARRARARTRDGHLLEQHELPMARALAGEVVLREDLVVEQDGRAFHFVTSAAPIQSEDGTKTMGAVGVVRDESERAEFEQVKDQFLRVAAHELKTPLTIIKAHAQGLQRALRSPEPRVRRMLDAINRGTNRLTHIVEDLVDISQLELGMLDVRMDPLDLGALVSTATARVAASDTHHAVRLVSSEPVRVRGDRERLDQCVRILLDNAVRYSPDGSSVDVAVKRDDGHAVVSVTDHGVGIPLEKQARIFQRFHRAHTDTPRDSGGLGVGLYLVQEIVQRHGGGVAFESVPEQGSTFRITVPASGE